MRTGLSSFEGDLRSDKSADERAHAVPRIEDENGCGNGML
jgi:hypothetical protein